MSVISKKYGELRLAGCPNHPTGKAHKCFQHCLQVRQVDDTALTVPQIWEVLEELSGSVHPAKVDEVVNCPPWCDVCDRFHRPGEKCGGKLTGGLSR